MSEQIYVIGYARVSTPKQAQTGESLDDQERYIRLHCEREGWKLYPDDTVFKEPYTGTTTTSTRPIYKEVLELLAKNKKKLNIKYLVFWDFDRFTRAGIEEYKQMWRDLMPLGVEPRDTAGVIQPEKNKLAEMGYDFEYDWTNQRPSEQAEFAKIQEAKSERAKILFRLIPPQIKNTQEGYHIGRADDGYASKKVLVGGKNKCVLEQVPARAKYITEMFTLCSEHIHTDEEVCKILNAKGFRTPIMRRWDRKKMNQVGKTGGIRLNVKQLRRYIERPAYAGFLCEKWTHHKLVQMKSETESQNIVSIELYNKANRGKFFIEAKDDGTYELHKNYSSWSGKRRKYNPDFPYRGVLVCDICTKPMTASKSTGKSGKKFGQYHCSRDHKYLGHAQTVVDSAFTTLLGKLAFTDDFLRILERTLIFEYRKRERESALATAQMNGRAMDLEKQKADAISAFIVTDNAIVRKGLEDKIDALEKEIIATRTERNKSEIKEEDLSDFIRWAKSLMEHPAKMLENIHSVNELRGVLGLIFAEFPTFQELTNGTPKLSLVFKLNQQFNPNNTQLVTPRGIEPRFHP